MKMQKDFETVYDYRVAMYLLNDLWGYLNYSFKLASKIFDHI
jgi:hypothetical protein